MEWIDGVELLLFSYDPESRDLFLSELEALKGFTGRFSFTLHLPDPLPLLAAENDPSGLMRLLDATESLADFYVLHPPRCEDLDSWAAALVEARKKYGEDRFLLEYTGKSAFEAALDAANGAAPDMPLCADTGCLLREGIDPVDWISERLPRIREVHLHGAAAQKDHRALQSSDAWALDIVRLAKENGWIVNLETFSIAETQKSRDALWV
jgi:sugar phosphate isomerase/epimerase